MKSRHVEEMKRAAAYREGMIGVCEGGFPIKAGPCEFCGATWEERCKRRDNQQLKP